MELSLYEAIDIIIGFSKFSAGYWRHIPIESPVVLKFIENGFACLDLEHQEKYVLTPSGMDILRPHIEEIHGLLVARAKDNRYSILNDEAIDYISQAYKINSEAAEKLYYYITSLQEINGIVCSSYSQGARRGVEFKKTKK